MSTTTTPSIAQSPPAESPSDGAIRGGVWPSADTVRSELRAAARPYDTQQISDVLWLLEYVRMHKLKSYEQLRAVMNFDGDLTVISRIMRGKYPGNYDPFFAKLRAFRSVLLERQDFGDEPIIETSVVTDVANLCDLARISATIGLLYGPNQSGKTTAELLYKERNNHGRTIYVRMPVGGSARMFALALAKACNISERQCYDQLRDRLLAYFDGTMLLIVDEVHQAFIGRSLKTVTIEFIREIHDLCKCGVVLCGTDVLPEMMEDSRFKKFLGQINNRGILRRRIPSQPPMKDVRAICTAYGLPAPEGDSLRLVKDIARESGIGKLTKYLRMARKLAANKSEPFGWAHFLSTHATLAAWATGETSKEEEE